jgi:Serpentine type 7TM GPCR chemoreceptor Srj.
VENVLRDKLATWLKSFLGHLGLDDVHAEMAEQLITMVVIIIISTIAYYLLKYIFGVLIKKLLNRVLITQELKNLIKKLLNKLIIVAVAIVVISFLPAAFFK